MAAQKKTFLDYFNGARGNSRNFAASRMRASRVTSGQSCTWSKGHRKRLFPPPTAPSTEPTAHRVPPGPGNLTPPSPSAGIANPRGDLPFGLPADSQAPQIVSSLPPRPPPTPPWTASPLDPGTSLPPPHPRGFRIRGATFLSVSPQIRKPRRLFSPSHRARHPTHRAPLPPLTRGPHSLLPICEATKDSIKG